MRCFMSTTCIATWRANWYLPKALRRFEVGRELDDFGCGQQQTPRSLYEMIEFFVCMFLHGGKGLIERTSISNKR